MLSQRQDFLTYEEFIGKLNNFDEKFLTILSLASMPKLHHEISSLYDKNKNIYYQNYKNSLYFNDKRILKISVLNQDATRKLIGISENQENIEKITLNLIKNGYKFVYNYIKNSSTVDLYVLRQKSLKFIIENKLAQTFGSAHLFSIALYLCKHFKKKILIEKDLFIVKLINDSLDQLNQDLMLKDLNGTYEEEIQKFLKMYPGLSLKKNTSLPLNHFLTNLNHIYKLQRAKGLKIIQSDEAFNSLADDHDVLHGLSFIATYLAYNNIDFIDLQNITPVNYNVVEDILKFCYSYSDPQESVPEKFGMLMITQALINDYKKTKDELLTTSMEEALIAAKSSQESYEAKLSLLKINEENREKEFVLLKSTISQMNNTIDLLNLKNKKVEIRYEKTLEKSNELSLQIKELKNQLANSIKVSLEWDLKNIIKSLSCIKGIIIGGDIKWQRSLFECLPSFKFIEPDELNKDLSFIKNADVIFFNSSYNSHSMFNKVQNEIRNSNLPLHYCGPTTNIEKSIEHIFSCVFLK
ncbi:hypothetical protein [Paenisporosarcina quisquiliarum]|uniref:hypothetical protein n=1 Tax=Paenisporosarcina quisquiliarum TaxID=365346 RepID=UPI003735F1C9